MNNTNTPALSNLSALISMEARYQRNYATDKACGHSLMSRADWLGFEAFNVALERSLKERSLVSVGGAR